MATEPAGARPAGPGPPLVVAIVVLVAGFVVAATGGIGALVTFVRTTLDTPVITLPADVHRHLDAGTYDVYQWTGSRRGAFGASVQDSGPPGLSPADVAVTAPDGSSVPVGYPHDGGLTTMTRGSHIYTPAARFSAPVSGAYTIRIRPAGGLPEVVISPSFGDVLRISAGWLATLGTGAGIGLVGLVMLLVGVIRRDRARPRAPVAAPGGAYGGPPAGWYPDPSGVARYRWWDGSRWTEHTG